MVKMQLRALAILSLTATALSVTATGSMAADANSVRCNGTSSAVAGVAGSDFGLTIYQTDDDDWSLVVTRDGRRIHRDTTPAQDVRDIPGMTVPSGFAWLADFSDIYLAPKPKRGKVVFTAVNAATGEVCTAVFRRR